MFNKKAINPTHIRSRGFTIAEVLITLGIIGIVAEMTIPTLIHNYQKQVVETQLKKAYAQYTQLFKNIIATNNCSDLICTGLFDSSLSKSDFEDNMEAELKKNIKIVKICKGTDSDPTACAETVKYFKGSTTELVYSNSTTGIPRVYFITAEGAKVNIANFNCAATQATANYLKNKCAYISVDLNADALPNTYGKDVFNLGYADKYGNIFPDGGIEFSKAQNNSAQYWKTATDVQYMCGEPNKTIAESSSASIGGKYCFARIYENNWRIDYW